MLAVLVANKDLSFGFPRYVDLDTVEFVVEPGAFTQWFMCGQLPVKPQQVVNMSEYGSMSNSYLGRYLDTPLGAPVVDWQARKLGQWLPEQVICAHPRFVIDDMNTVATWGDVNYMEHGGQLLVRGPAHADAAHDSNMWLENVEPPEEGPDIDRETARWVVHRIDPERLALMEIDQQLYLVDHSYYLRSLQPYALAFTSAHESWLHGQLAAVADSCDRTMQNLRDMLCDADVTVRSRAYIDIAEHIGWHEFDSYSLQLTMHEAHTRYANLTHCGCDYCELIVEKTQLCHKDELLQCEIDRLGEINVELEGLERAGKC